MKTTTDHAHRARSLGAWISGRITSRNVVPIALALLVAFGIGDIITDVELTFTLLYLFPVALGTWFRSRAFGLLLAGLATCFAAAVILMSNSLISKPGLFTVWNSAGTFGTLAVVAYVLDALRVYVEREQHEKKQAVEQLRHAERLSALGTLAAGVAHELGTPLGVIAGNAELLEMGAGDTTHRATQLRVIQDQTKRITKIVRGLLDFSRRAGTGRAVVPLDRIASSAADLVASTLERQKCTVVVEVMSSKVDVCVNPAEIEQVVVNLLSNGAQAMPEGGELRVRCEKRRGKLGSARDADLAAIVVEDHGIGIAPEALPHIFDPFFTTKDTGQGTGLGLSISYGIVSDHGGHIDVKSILGKGSIFEVLLPAHH